MSKPISPIISAKELIASMKDENLVIVDTTTKIFDKNEQRFIKGALLVNLDTQLSHIKKYLSRYITSRQNMPCPLKMNATHQKNGAIKNSLLGPRMAV